MFGLGLSEILIIAAIALVVLGPEKFPEFAKIALRAFRDLRGYVDDIKREMAEELNPVKNELTKLAQYNVEDYVAPITEALSGIESDVTDEIKKSVDAVTDETSPKETSGESAPSVSENPQEAPDKETDSAHPAMPADEMGSFSEGKRHPEPTPGGESKTDTEIYPD